MRRVFCSAVRIPVMCLCGALLAGGGGVARRGFLFVCCLWLGSLCGAVTLRAQAVAGGSGDGRVSVRGAGVLRTGEQLSQWGVSQGNGGVVEWSVRGTGVLRAVDLSSGRGVMAVSGPVQRAVDLLSVSAEGRGVVEWSGRGVMAVSGPVQRAVDLLSVSAEGRGVVEWSGWGFMAVSGPGLVVSGGLHGMIPNAPEFPEVRVPSVSLGLQWFDGWRRRQSRPWWPALGRPDLYWGGKWQALGNRRDLGYGVSLVRGMSWRRPLGSGAMVTRLGGGVAYLSERYEYGGTGNMVNGGPWAFNMQLSWAYELARGLAVQLVWDHYSSGGRYAPNRGYNLMGVELCYGISLGAGVENGAGVAVGKVGPGDVMRVDSGDIAVHSDGAEDRVQAFGEGRLRGFVRAIGGVTQRNLRGPDYPVAGLQIGLLRNSGSVHQWRLGAERLRDESNRVFLKETGIPGDRARRESTRWLVSVGHGFRLDRLVLVTDLGVYLTRHYNRGGLFGTRIGVEYQQNFSRKKYSPGFFGGIYVRSYGLEADFTELSGGLLF